MQNSTQAQISNATESLTLYIIHTLICPDPIYHSIFQDYYWRAFGVNLDLCPNEVIRHCEWLKQNPECLFYHYYNKDLSEQGHMDMLDAIIKDLKEGS